MKKRRWMEIVCFGNKYEISMDLSISLKYMKIRATMDGNRLIGKVNPRHRVCYLPHNGQEVILVVMMMMIIFIGCATFRWQSYKKSWYFCLRLQFPLTQRSPFEPQKHHQRPHQWVLSRATRYNLEEQSSENSKYKKNNMLQLEWHLSFTTRLWWPSPRLSSPLLRPSQGLPLPCWYRKSLL